MGHVPGKVNVIIFFQKKTLVTCITWVPSPVISPSAQERTRRPQKRPSGLQPATSATCFSNLLLVSPCIPLFILFQYVPVAWPVSYDKVQLNTTVQGDSGWPDEICRFHGTAKDFLRAAPGPAPKRSNGRFFTGAVLKYVRDGNYM